MRNHDPGSSAVLLILPDNTALRFNAVDVESRGRQPVSPQPSLGDFIKSFLPQIRRVRPERTVLPSGKIATLFAGLPADKQSAC